MKLKKRLLAESRLYVIIDKDALGRKPIFNLAGAIKDSPVDIIQLRDKESKKEVIFKEALLLYKLLLGTNTIFIINDYLDIAKITDSDGIHLGQLDTSIKTARRILGKDKIIGISCHNLRQALRAQKNGADYISIGPIFPTSTKPEYKHTGLDFIREVKKNIKIPFFAIGGINQDNIGGVISSGAKRIVVCRPVCQASNTLEAIKKLKKQLPN